MKITSHLLSAAMTLALGILFVVLRANVVGICITVLGIALLVLGILDLVHGDIVSGIIKMVLGVAVLLIGWLLLDLALLILGIVILVYSASEIAKTVKEIIKNKNKKIVEIVLGLIEPALCLVASIFLITSRGSAIDITVLIAGIILIVNGALSIARAVVANKK